MAGVSRYCSSVARTIVSDSVQMSGGFWQKGFAGWVAACLFLVLYSTVIGRILGSNGSKEGSIGSSVHLMLFWSIGSIQDGHIETLYEKICNVLFFVPYGFLLGLYFNEKVIKCTLLVGVITSICIEFLQLLTRSGTCETDIV